MNLRHALALALSATCAAAPIGAQALTSTLSLSVRHSTQKNNVRPTGELKAQIDSIDAQLAVANRFGRTGELRRLYAKANALLSRRPWTPEAEFAASLLLRTEHQVVDPSQRWRVRVEQLFLPSIELTRPLHARAQLRQRAPNAPPTAPLTVVRELGEFDAVPRDLRESPLMVEADLKGVADGNYVMAVELRDSTRVLGTATLPIVLRNGLGALMGKLESAAAKAAEPVRSDLLYPIDRLRLVNAGRVTLATFNAAREFAAAESLLTRVQGGRDPWVGRTGDLKRHYRLTSADEILPYRLFIPSRYSAATARPLIIALHGLGATEDSFFDAYGQQLPTLAEKYGFIVAAPLGYRVDGGYGVNLVPSTDPAVLRAREYSEQDVLQVIEEVRRHYKVDPARIYLIGHSMGAIGTWALATKYPDRWAALAAFSGFGTPGTAKTIAHIPQFVVHGDADATVAVGGSRVMIAALRGVGADVVYVEVPGGDHLNVVEPNFAAMFEFFEKHRARRSATP